MVNKPSFDTGCLVQTVYIHEYLLKVCNIYTVQVILLTLCEEAENLYP